MTQIFDKRVIVDLLPYGDDNFITFFLMASIWAFAAFIAIFITVSLIKMKKEVDLEIETLNANMKEIKKVSEDLERKMAIFNIELFKGKPEKEDPRRVKPIDNDKIIPLWKLN